MRDRRGRRGGERGELTAGAGERAVERDICEVLIHGVAGDLPGRWNPRQEAQSLSHSAPVTFS